jgi:hypothetical protein
MSDLTKQEIIGLFKLAPEWATTYGLVGSYERPVFYNQYKYQYLSGEQCEKSFTFDQGHHYLEFTLMANKPEDVPVFTQQMQKSGEFPIEGSKVIIEDKFNDCWDAAKNLVGVPVTVMACFYGLGKDGGNPIKMVVVSLEDGLCCCFRADYCKPIDTRTNEEKAIDQACLVVDDSIRCRETNVNIACSAAQKSVIVTLIKKGYRKVLA